MTSSRLICWSGLSAMVAGVLFVVIQPIHPPDTLASVTTDEWVWIHWAKLVMLAFFAAGIAGIYARQVKESGGLGLAGFILLSLGTYLTAALTIPYGFVLPLIADEQPAFTEGALSLVNNELENTADLGALPAIVAASSGLFILGIIALGIATRRARVLPRQPAAILAIGLPAIMIADALLPFAAYRLGALPVGIGLVWLGYALWSEPGSAANDANAEHGASDTTATP